ncbi:hypothetical protein L6452_38546 [Arctium lappa]|uniref:Uncharacterized protein n=1 Tax=Arctium lappa TaxID=4217 RepID=A0ACB8XR06_ARCLA|nr:hypothetical protein L6452_38546 [Arctium lappa]
MFSSSIDTLTSLQLPPPSSQSPLPLPLTIGSDFKDFLNHGRPTNVSTLTRVEKLLNYDPGLLRNPIGEDDFTFMDLPTRKCEKDEKSEKLKVKKAIEKAAGGFERSIEAGRKLEKRMRDFEVLDINISSKVAVSQGVQLRVKRKFDWILK